MRKLIQICSVMISVLQAQEPCRIACSSTIALKATPRSITSGDLNSDGILDVAVAGFGGIMGIGNNLQIILNRSAAVCDVLEASAGDSVDWIAVHPMHSGSKGDIVALSTELKQLKVFQGTGDGRVLSPQLYDLGSMPTCAEIADLNADGTPDVLIGLHDLKSTKCYMGTGDGKLDKPMTIPMDIAPSHISIGDFDNDGTLDMAILSYTSNRVEITELNAKGRNNLKFGSYSVENPLLTRTMDMNSDGFMDLLVLADGIPARVKILYADSRLFKEAADVTLGNNAMDMTVTQSQGKHEILVVDGRNPEVLILRECGNNVWVEQGKLRVGMLPNHIMSIEIPNGSTMERRFYVSNRKDRSLSVLTQAMTAESKPASRPKK